MREWFIFNFLYDKIIDDIYKKNWSSFAIFQSFIFMRYDFNWCSIIFWMRCMLICCEFIDEYELFNCVIYQFTHSLISQFWIILYNTYLDLGIRKFKEIVIKKRMKWYLFFDHLIRFSMHLIHYSSIYKEGYVFSKSRSD